MVGLLSLESCCGKPKMRNSRRTKRQEMGRHPIGYVSYSVFKLSDVMRKIQG